VFSHYAFNSTTDSLQQGALVALKRFLAIRFQSRMIKVPFLVPSQTIIGKTLASLRGVLVGVALFSALVNLLALTGSLFMLQVYDRVLSSRSVPTLVALAIVTVGLYTIQGALDFIRARVLVRMGIYVEECLCARVYNFILQIPLKMKEGIDTPQPIRDLDSIRSFLSGPGPTAILDMPWLPFYLGFVFLLHPYLGLTATFGAIVLIGLTITTELLSKKPTREALSQAVARTTLTISGRRNAEVVRAMGFGNNLAARFMAVNARYLSAQKHASDVIGGLSVLSRMFRAVLQSTILALGAFLVIRGEVSAGAIIASSITSSRALAPVELAIAHWKGFLAARQSRRRLDDLFNAFPAPMPPLALPVPTKTVDVENVSVTAPGRQGPPIVYNVSFRLEAGDGLGIIGPSAAGKSTLARAIVGVWPALRGDVRLDGASLEQWDDVDRGRHIGYLPQDIELFEGTVAENIARLESEPDPQTVVAAARAADVHDMILRLPDGYQTPVGESGMSLSAGQRQRIGLARALYGEPFLVVLDEPNSNLDSDGEIALTSAILGVRARGGIAVVVAHRPSAIAAVDLLAVLSNGMLQAFGAKDEVLPKITQKSSAALSSAALRQPNLSVVANSRAKRK
jgi:ATP-binding cassette subfamily C protein